MARISRSCIALVLPLLVIAGLAVGRAAPVTAAAEPAGRVSLFPTDALTVPDFLQATGRRVNLPLPDCRTQPSDCTAIAQLNQLDGFDLDPRLAIGFDHAVDPSAVAAATTVRRVDDGRRGAAIGVDRVVYDAAAHTVYAHPVTQLAAAARYELVVRERNGRAARSIFTTQSATSGLLGIRRELDSGLAYLLAGIPPSARGLQVDDDVPADGTTLSYTQDEGAKGGRVTVPVFNTSFAGAGRYVFGSFLAPSWINANTVIPQLPTRFLAPLPRGQARLPFVLIVPAGPVPAGGWPVAIFGHGFTGSDANLFLAADLNASNGIATIATDVVGHGFGPASTWNITRGGKTNSIPAHARGTDRDGDGVIMSTEGVSPLPQPNPDAAVNDRDGLRQTVADEMTLVRAIGRGLDLRGNGQSVLRRTGVSYYGQSFGGIYGTMLGGVDPLVQVLALNVAGGPITEIARLSPSFRPLVEQNLAQRVPPLLNGGFDNFTESMPLRGQPPVTDPAPGALAIQAVLARETWLDRSGSAETYAPLLRATPPRGSTAKKVIFQNAFGDQTVPNPTNYTLLAAGGLFDRESLYRNDLTANAARNPHGFLLDPTFVGGNLPGQRQIVTFLASGGQTVIDPDGPGPVWEVPINDPAELLSLNFQEPAA